MHVFAMVFAGIPDSRKTEERQGVAPAPADLDMLATLRLDACSSPDLMREQYRVRPCHWWIWNAQRSCAVPKPGKRTLPGHCCLFMLTEPL